MRSKSESEKLFSSYLSSRQILIADKNSASRTGVAKLLISLGGKTNNLSIASNYENALSILKQKRPEVLISDYEFDGGNGLDLAQEFFQLNSSSRNSVFIMLTANSSQSLVAQAAEENVDLFILKPYTIKSFTESLINAVLNKIYPSDYIKTIEAGKEQLANSEPELAIQTFEKAMTLNSKPALALYYRGQAELFKKMLESAEASYKGGLEYNDIHYKCLVSLFDLLMKQNKKVDAYTIVKKIATIFPANPNRLAQVLTLAVQTGNLKDIESYYESFRNIDVRNEQIIKYISAALVVCGKHYLRQNILDKGRDLLNKAAITGSLMPHILREIIDSFLEVGQLEDAVAVLKRFSGEASHSTHFHVSQFLILKHQETDPTRLVSHILELIRNSVEDPVLYFWLIYYLKKLKKDEQAEEMTYQAVKKWPNQAAFFEKASL